MVFRLSQDIGRAIVASPSTELINALQHLADSRRCGLNEVLGDRDVLRTVSRCEHLSKSARAVYQRLAEMSTRMHNLLYECAAYVLVTAEPSICRREMSGTQEQIILSVEFLARGQRLAQQPALLCENLDDCDFMVWLGIVHGFRMNLPERIQLSKRNGGGSTTAKVYEDILKSKEELCLCISDSDLKFEGDTAEGGTACALCEVNSCNDSTLACLHILQCHEAENLIPASVLADVYASDPQKLSAVPDLEGVQSNEAHQLWRYYDVKNGIRAFEFINSPKLQYIASWTRVFGCASDVKKHMCRVCPEVGACEKKAECMDYLAKGFGASVLTDTVREFLTKNSRAEIVRRLTPRMLAEWELVGRLIWTWGIAGCNMAA